MLNASKRFSDNLTEARSLGVLHDYLKAQLGASMSFDDLLRSQLVYSVSAFDKLVHDIVRVGMVAIFSGKRIATSRYHNETISIAFHGSLITATMPPKEHLFEQEVVRKLRTVSYQDPDNIAEGLSYIWSEAHKWQKIGAAMGLTRHDVRTKLKLIATRRNNIVHEADIDPISNMKNRISRSECDDITNFLEHCGQAIVSLVV